MLGLRVGGEAGVGVGVGAGGVAGLGGGLGGERGVLFVVVIFFEGFGEREERRERKRVSERSFAFFKGRYRCFSPPAFLSLPLSIVVSRSSGGRGDSSTREREREEADKGREVAVEEGDESGFLRSLRSLAWWSIFVVLLPICFPTISSLALSFLSASNSPTSRSGGRWRPVALEDWLREVVSKRV